METVNRKSAKTRPLRILVIDDDEEMTLLMKDVLQVQSYEVEIAHNGLEAVQKSKQERFDLILLDIRMPFFSGFWFCDAFKMMPSTKNIPVIMVTALREAENMEKAYQVGASAYLIKPFRSEQLLDMVEKILS